MRQLVYTMFSTNNYASFHLRWKKNLVKYQKVLKYYFHDCSLDTKFQRKLKIFIFFCPDLFKKGFSGLKQKKRTPNNFYIILYNQTSTKFQLEMTILIFVVFEPNLLKKVFPVKNWKSEHHHWILHIQISFTIKFPLRLTQFMSWYFFWLPSGEKT